MRITTFLAPFIFAASLSWASDNSQDYNIDGVRSLEITNAAIANIRVGSPASVTARADAEVLQRAVVEQNGDRLILGVEGEGGRLFGWFNGNNDRIIYDVVVEELASLKLNGAARAELAALEGQTLELELIGASELTAGDLSFEHIDLELVGASKVKLGVITVDSFAVSATGASSVHISQEGNVQQLQVNLTGASKLKADKLVASQAKVTATGASHAEVQVKERLDASAVGASHIRYKGDPRVQVQSSGASRISSH